MIDNLIILAFGFAVICVIFIVAGAISEWKDWK